MDIENPTFNGSGGIDCMIDHPLYGRIPFTAREDDPEAMGRAVYAAALEIGPAPYVAPPLPDPLEAERARMVVSRLQARAALLEADLLDTVEKAVNGSVLSGSKVTPLVRLAWNEATEFRRSSPTIAAVGQLLGLAEDQLDELFRAAMRIEF